MITLVVYFLNCLDRKLLAVLFVETTGTMLNTSEDVVKN